METIKLTEEETKRFFSLFRPGRNSGYCERCNVWSDRESDDGRMLCAGCAEWLKKQE